MSFRTPVDAFDYILYVLYPLFPSPLLKGAQVLICLKAGQEARMPVLHLLSKFFAKADIIEISDHFSLAGGARCFSAQYVLKSQLLQANAPSLMGDWLPECVIWNGDSLQVVRTPKRAAPKRAGKLCASLNSFIWKTVTEPSLLPGSN